MIEASETVTADIVPASLHAAKHFIGGEWVASRDGRTLDVENPSDRSILATIARGGEAEINMAVAAGKAASRSWRDLPARERGRFLSRLGDAVGNSQEPIARLMAAETGNALRTQARGEIAAAADVLRYFGGVAAEQKGEVLPFGPSLLSYSVREPLGVVASIIPWNAPVVLAAVKIAMALCTGNTMVLKPAEDAPLAVLRMVELAADILPPGVLNAVNGTGLEAGQPLARHPDIAKISFTGSTTVGKEVMRAAADTIIPVTLELGGKSPSIVYPDSCDDATVDGVIAAMRFLRQGQSCTAGSRLFLHRDIYTDFLERLVAKLKLIKVGPALDEATDMGAIINRKQFDRVCGYLTECREQGANMPLGGSPPVGGALSEGWFLEPTVITGIDNTWRAMREEIFGPVMVAIPWDDEDLVVQQANATHYGLAAYIWCRDIQRSLRIVDRIDAGWVQVNRGGGQIPGMSYGGRKQSGIGSEYSIEGALEAYTRRKSVTVTV